MRPLLASLIALTLASNPSAAFAAPITFDDITQSAGLLGPLEGIMGHGAAFGDIDGDGLLDLYVGGFADRPDAEYTPAPAPVANVLLRNLGDGRFEPWQTPAAAIFARTSGAVFADLDNDGDPDLYVANNTKGKTRFESGPQRTAQLNHSKLFENKNATLHDISASSGACPDTLGTARNIGVFDYDRDGLLDLFVVEDRFTKNPRSTLFRNLGNLRFTDANQSAGLPDDIFGLGLAVADINDDLRPDFFVPHSNRFFLSTADGRYREDASLTKTLAWDPLDNEDWPCGAAFGDLNRDGLLDLVLAIHGSTARNRVYLNRGLKNSVPQFQDATTEVGLPPHVAAKTPHIEIQDLDNDGWPDLYFTVARLDDDGSITPLVYRNLGTDQPGAPPRFKASFDTTTTPPDQLVYFPAGPSADIDNDGRIDLFLVNWFRGNHCRLLKNTSTNDSHWLRVNVRGRTFNRDGIGTQIKVFATVNGQRQLVGFQELTTGYGYASGQDTACHFGLGEHTKVDLEIRFPDGTTKMIPALESIDQTIILSE